MSAGPGILVDLRQAAAEVLAKGTVGVVIGYARENGSSPSTPFFARKPEEAERLVFDELCFANLAVYLPRTEVRAMGRTGLVVKGCDLRAVNVLLRENVIKREELFLIGVRCNGVGETQPTKCAACEAHEPPDCDVVVGESADYPQPEPDKRYRDAAAIEALSCDERWRFWQRQMSKCIRCYACRQVCPLCYCKQCIVEKSVPQWVETSAHLRGNVAWHTVRALHLTGRCVGCGECERACPVGIPLGALNQKMSKTVEEWFDFRSGLSADEKAPFTVWEADDPEVEIL